MDRNSPLTYEAIITCILFFFTSTLNRTFSCIKVEFIHIFFKNLFLNHKGEAIIIITIIIIIIIIKTNMALFTKTPLQSSKREATAQERVQSESRGQALERFLG